MRYKRVAEYDGYIYDSDNYEYITPKGRLVEKPGMPFHGTLSKQEFANIQAEVSDIKSGDFGDWVFATAENLPSINKQEHTMRVEVVVEKNGKIDTYVLNKGDNFTVTNVPENVPVVINIVD